MAQSLRVVYRHVQGRIKANFNWAPIHEKSAVIITAAEWHLSGGVFGLAGTPVLGDADVYVTNIYPHDSNGGGVGFVLHVNWTAPLDVIVTISVLEDVVLPAPVAGN